MGKPIVELHVPYTKPYMGMPGIRVKQVPSLGAGWLELFRSPEMQAVVDSAGKRIAAEAGEPHFGYKGRMGRSTAGGFVSSMDYAGAYYEATDKRLTKAVHR